MIYFARGDILKHDAEALVNTVNCMGVMGRGIALEFRRAFDDNYLSYRKAAQAGDVRPGRMFVFRRDSFNQPRWIINFPTKRHWKGKSKIEDVKNGLIDLVHVIQEHAIKSVAIPPLGCGLGGLDWRVVRPLIVEALSSLTDVDCFIYEPGYVRTAVATTDPKTRPDLTSGRAALLALINTYLEAQMDFEITLLEIHKLMYFLQTAGEPLKLRFQKAFYGPYAENLPHVLKFLDNHYIKGYGDSPDAPTKTIELIGDAGIDGLDFLQNQPETLDRFRRVGRLIEGFETPFGMELLSTVHWVVDQEHAKTIEEVTAKVHAWNTRKEMFNRHQIETAWNRLFTAGWINTNHVI